MVDIDCCLFRMTRVGMLLKKSWQGLIMSAFVVGFLRYSAVFASSNIA